jgi:hypothetical protein
VGAITSNLVSTSPSGASFFYLRGLSAFFLLLDPSSIFVFNWSLRPDIQFIFRRLYSFTPWWTLFVRWKYFADFASAIQVVTVSVYQNTTVKLPQD